MINRVQYLFFAVWLLFSCTKNIEIAGGTETETTITGQIIDKNSKPAANVKVELFPIQFNPTSTDSSDKKVEVYSDENGVYTFNNVDQGSYNVTASIGSEGTAGIIQKINIDNGEKKDLDINLQPTGDINLSTEIFSNLPGLIYIPGTNLSMEVSEVDLEKGNVVLENIPVSTYTEILFVTDDSLFGKDILVDSIQIVPEEVYVIGPFHLWNDTSKIIINTSASGADIPEPLYNYPALIRLNANSNLQSSFINKKIQEIFSKAQPGGADLRFSNPNGAAGLSFEIERWDSALGLAEIWIRVDTIFGDNSSQFIYMYSGNPLADQQSTSDGVFSQQQSYVGVWHLRDDNNPDTVYHDATVNNNHAKMQGLIGGSDSNCRVGGCPTFDGVDDYLVVPNHESLDMGGSFTVSLWVQFQGGIPINYPRILDRKIDFRDLNGWTIALGHTSDSRIGVQGSDTLGSVFDNFFSWSSGNWEYLAFVFDQDSVTIFSNGEKVSTLSHVPIIDNDNDLYIGQYPGGGQFFWKGKMDEIRLSNNQRSNNWIKLNYENQKEGSRVVKIE